MCGYVYVYKGPARAHICLRLQMTARLRHDVREHIAEVVRYQREDAAALVNARLGSPRSRVGSQGQGHKGQGGVVGDGDLVLGEGSVAGVLRGLQAQVDNLAFQQVLAAWLVWLSQTTSSHPHTHQQPQHPQQQM